MNTLRTILNRGKCESVEPAPVETMADYPDLSVMVEWSGTVAPSNRHIAATDIIPNR